jgi:hypothetical protein
MRRSAFLTATLALGAALAAAGATLGDPAAGRLYVRPGDAGLRAVIELAIEPGWVLYHSEVGGDLDERGAGYPGRPLLVRPVGTGMTFSPARLPEPRRKEDPQLRNWAWVHQGRIRIYLVADGPGAAVSANLRVALSGSTCSDAGVCMRYDETLEPSGPGRDDLFAGFPEDLRAPTPP